MVFKVINCLVGNATNSACFRVYVTEYGFFPFKTLLLSKFLSWDYFLLLQVLTQTSEALSRDMQSVQIGERVAEGQKLSKSTFFLWSAHFVAAPSQVEPTEGERIYLILKETKVHSELGSFCALNDTWGPLTFCQLLGFQKGKGIQHRRKVVGLMVIRHHADCQEQKSGKHDYKAGKAEMI